MRLEVGLMLGSFFLGGLFIGAVSPGRRLLEPGVGAGIAAADRFFQRTGRIGGLARATRKPQPSWSNSQGR